MQPSQWCRARSLRPTTVIETQVEAAFTPGASRYEWCVDPRRSAAGVFPWARRLRQRSARRASQRVRQTQIVAYAWPCWVAESGIVRLRPRGRIWEKGILTAGLDRETCRRTTLPMRLPHPDISGLDVAGKALRIEQRTGAAVAHKLGFE